METLGLTRNELTHRVHYFSNDGANARSEELPYSTGLQLRNKFASWLGLNDGDITGHHDIAHNLQLFFFSDVFLKNNTFSQFSTLSNLIYNAMSDLNLEKVLQYFKILQIVCGGLC